MFGMQGDIIFLFLKNQGMPIISKITWQDINMRTGRISNRKLMHYSKLVCSAMELGVSFNDLISETRKYHGVEFGNRVEATVRDMRNHR